MQPHLLVAQLRFARSEYAGGLAGVSSNQEKSLRVRLDLDIMIELYDMMNIREGVFFENLCEMLKVHWIRK